MERLELEKHTQKIQLNINTVVRNTYVINGTLEVIENISKQLAIH